MIYLMLGIGLLMLIKGADVMVGSASKIAKMFNVAPFIVGLFIVAMGTSAPEAAIGVFSGIKGTNLVTLGDVIGSSIVNITIVIGITAIVFPLKVDSQVPKRVMPLSIFIQAVMILMFFTGNLLSRVEAGILLAGMFLFTGYIVSKTKEVVDKEKPDSLYEEDVFEYIGDQDILCDSVTGDGTCETVKVDTEKDSLTKLVVLLILGLAALVIGANVSVNSAVEIAQSIGLSEEFIGITIVAFGTSLPELVTCLIAAVKKEEDIAVGNIIGSNIFNVLFVLGLSGMIHPISVGNEVFADMLFMVGASILLLVPTYFAGNISKKSGFVFFAYYVLFLAYKLSSLGSVH